jgi:hypothetical protein
MKAHPGGRLLLAPVQKLLEGHGAVALLVAGGVDGGVRRMRMVFLQRRPGEAANTGGAQGDGLLRGRGLVLSWLFYSATEPTKPRTAGLPVLLRGRLG